MSARRGIQPAVRRGKKARIALDGPAGSGKTWTALMTACELVGKEGKILVIDTERGSAALYSDDFTFDELVWEPPYDPRDLAETLADQSVKYDVIVVDSLSHFWRGEGGTLDIVDSSARRDVGGNRMGGWKTGTPAQNSMVDSLLLAKCHVIVTMRATTEWVLEKDEKTGKTKPRKIGLAPVQRTDLDYEFTVVADLDLEHAITISKTRCHPLADRVFPSGHGQKFGKILHDWLDSAEEQPAPTPPAAPATTNDSNKAGPPVATERPPSASVATSVSNGHGGTATPPATGDLAAQIEAAIDRLQGADRGKFLGRNKLKIVSGTCRVSLNAKSADELAAMAADLGIQGEVPEPTPEAVDVPEPVAEPAPKPDTVGVAYGLDPDDIPFRAAPSACDIRMMTGRKAARTI